MQEESKGDFQEFRDFCTGRGGKNHELHDLQFPRTELTGSCTRTEMRWLPWKGRRRLPKKGRRRLGIGQEMPGIGAGRGDGGAERRRAGVGGGASAQMREERLTRSFRLRYLSFFG